MASPPNKPPASTGLVSNPFIKKRNLEWSINIPDVRDDRARDAPTKRRRRTERSVSPPEARGTRPERSAEQHMQHGRVPKGQKINGPSEQGGNTSEAIRADRIDALTAHLATHTLLSPSPQQQQQPLLRAPACKALFRSCLASPHGAHFVVQQHDHPVAGLHYDLRLQINGTSSVSWAIAYGLPGGGGGPRLAVETRVHSLLPTHMSESASLESGSMLIWDAGTYRVLETRERGAGSESETEGSSSQSSADDAEDGQKKTQQEKLAAAFAARKIRLRLDGARLPRPYVVCLRVTRPEDLAARDRAAAAATNRRGRASRRGPPPQLVETSSSSSSRSGGDDGGDGDDETAEVRTRQQDEHVRRTNAYVGATNSIGSVHQRRWYLSLDKKGCGIVQESGGKGRNDGFSTASSNPREGRHKGERENGTTGSGDGDVDRGTDEAGGATSPFARLSFPFRIRGLEFERSVVTGRLAADVLRDDGVVGHVSRKGWRPPR